MKWLFAIPTAFLLVKPISAQDLPDRLSCSGSSWSLTLDGDDAQFDYGFTSELTVQLRTYEADTSWPVALTLIGRRDSAIVILEPAECGPAPYRALVLTQRGETPLLLSGCCAPD